MRALLAALVGTALVAAAVAVPEAPATAAGVLPTAVMAAATETEPAALPTSSRQDVSGIPALPEMIAAPHPLDVDALPASGAAPQLQAPSQQSVQSAEGTSTMSGTIDWWPDNSAAAGVVVTAYLFGPNGKATVGASATTAADGTFSLSGLASGTYYIDLFSATHFDSPVHQWYGSTAVNPYGTAVTLTDGDTTQIYFAMNAPLPVSGHVTCEQCAAPPNPADVTIVFAVQDPVTTQWVGVSSEHPEADGAYAFSANGYANGGFRIYAEYSGTDSLAPVTASPVFPTVSWNDLRQDVAIGRLVVAESSYWGVIPTIHALYWDFLHRSPAESDVVFWNDHVGERSGAADTSQITASFVDSDEYRLIRIDSAYESVLGRAAEPGGRLSWLHAMQAGSLTPDDAETSLYASAEYFQQHGATDTGFVKALYAALLHRSGTNSDYTFWAQLAAQHGRGWVIAQFWDTTETISERVSAMYEQYLGRTPDPSGLAGWVAVSLQIGDSGLRAGLTSSSEYAARANTRYIQAGEQW